MRQVDRGERDLISCLVKVIWHYADVLLNKINGLNSICARLISTNYLDIGRDPERLEQLAPPSEAYSIERKVFYGE